MNRGSGVHIWSTFESSELDQKNVLQSIYDSKNTNKITYSQQISQHRSQKKHQRFRLGSATTWKRFEKKHHKFVT